jgi:phenylpyruvate tautomerase PptA (4-oxalocrotonate tautomerase family)
MPIIHIYSPQPSAPQGLLREMCQQVCGVMSIPPDRTWAMWHEVRQGNYWRPDWEAPGGTPGPTVIINCQQKHSPENVKRMMEAVRAQLATALQCPPASVFVAVLRVSEVLELPPAPQRQT